VVVRVHAVYRAHVLASETPESFAGRWEDDAEDATRALVESAYAGDPELADYVRVFRGYRGQLRQYFRAQLVRNFERYPISWLSDPALYRYVRAMMEAGRIRALRGDLLGPTTVLGVGDAARKVGVPIRVAYLSNAEEWFAYDEDFRASFAALPRDERSVVLRTLTMHRLPRGDPTWHYQVESLDHFAAALADPAFRRIQEIVPQAQLDEDGLSRIAVEVPE
jgi:hypothetical protein